MFTFTHKCAADNCCFRDIVSYFCHQGCKLSSHYQVEKKHILLCALMHSSLTKLIHTPPVLLQLPQDSHDKSDGGKRQHCGEHLFVASSHQVMVLGKVFHEVSFFFFMFSFAWEQALVFTSRRGTSFQASPLVWKTAEIEHCCSCCLGKTR